MSRRELAENLETTLRTWFCRLEVAIAAVPVEEHPLFAAEASFMERAVPSRRADFSSGRFAARRALSRFGVGECAIPSGERRAPRWPTGFVGSISHSGGLASAIVARAGDVRAIGLDIEVAAALPAEVEALVVNDDRLGEARLASTIAFSAKESVYKALYPARGWLLEFADVHLELGDESFVATARMGDEREIVSGRFAIVDSMVVTAIVVASRESEHFGHGARLETARA